MCSRERNDVGGLEDETAAATSAERASMRSDASCAPLQLVAHIQESQAGRYSAGAVVVAVVTVPLAGATGVSVALLEIQSTLLRRLRVPDIAFKS